MNAVTAALPPALHHSGVLQLKGFANLPAQELARLTCSSLRTVRRWKQTLTAPAGLVRLLELLLDGPLGLISAAWEGWKLRDGRLWSPEGSSFTPGEIRALPLHHQRINELERQLRRVLDSVGPVRPLTLTLHIEIDPADSGHARVVASQFTPVNGDDRL